MATLLQIRDRIKARTDNKYTDGFVTDDEIDGLINQHYKELYELLQFAGPHRVETEYTIDAATDFEADSRAPLPANTYSIMTVHRVETDGSHTLLARHDHRSKPLASTNNTRADTYRVAGGMRLELDPVPASGEYLVTYIPVPSDLTDDDDTLDGVLGWEEYVVVAASLDIAISEAVDLALIGALERQLDRQTKRITKAAKNAELSEAPRVVDVRESALSATDWSTAAWSRTWRGWGW